MLLRSSGDRRTRIYDGEADVSYLATVPQQLEVAAQQLAGIRSSLAGSAASALTRTTAAAAQDDISTVVATMFNSFGQDFHALSAQADAFHQQFANSVNQGASAYVTTEVANARAALQAAESSLPSVLGGSARLSLGGGVVSLPPNLGGGQVSVPSILTGGVLTLPPNLGGGHIGIPSVVTRGVLTLPPNLGGGHVTVPPITSGLLHILGL